jgi:hypothetical protein
MSSSIERVANRHTPKPSLQVTTLEVTPGHPAPYHLLSCVLGHNQGLSRNPLPL